MSISGNLNREIGLRVRALREQQSLSRERLAEAANLSVQFLADIETGRKGMTVLTLRKLAVALRCSADELIFGSPAWDHNESPSLPAHFSSLSPQQLNLASDILSLVLQVLPQPPSAREDGEEKPAAE